MPIKLNTYVCDNCGAEDNHDFFDTKHNGNSTTISDKSALIDTMRETDWRIVVNSYTDKLIEAFEKGDIDDEVRTAGINYILEYGVDFTYCYFCADCADDIVYNE